MLTRAYLATVTKECGIAPPFHVRAPGAASHPESVRPTFIFIPKNFQTPPLNDSMLYFKLLTFDFCLLTLLQFGI